MHCDYMHCPSFRPSQRVTARTTYDVITMYSFVFRGNNITEGCSKLFDNDLKRHYGGFVKVAIVRCRRALRAETHLQILHNLQFLPVTLLQQVNKRRWNFHSTVARNVLFEFYPKKAKNARVRAYNDDAFMERSLETSHTSRGFVFRMYRRQTRRWCFFSTVTSKTIFGTTMAETFAFKQIRRVRWRAGFERFRATRVQL